MRNHTHNRPSSTDASKPQPQLKVSIARIQIFRSHRISACASERVCVGGYRERRRATGGKQAPTPYEATACETEADMTNEKDALDYTVTSGDGGSITFNQPTG